MPKINKPLFKKGDRLLLKHRKRGSIAIQIHKIHGWIRCWYYDYEMDGVVYGGGNEDDFSELLIDKL